MLLGSQAEQDHQDRRDSQVHLDSQATQDFLEDRDCKVSLDLKVGLLSTEASLS